MREISWGKRFVCFMLGGENGKLDDEGELEEDGDDEDTG